MFDKPQSEHHWLDQLVGDWRLQHDCTNPDGNTSRTTGTIRCRSLGGMWVICESNGESAHGDTWSSVMALGFDPRKDCFVGTFVGSMMPSIWLYEGNLDPSSCKRLPLETEGPAFLGHGTCKYRDTIEIVDAEHWLFTSELRNEAGEWIRFLNGTHVRTSS